MSLAYSTGRTGFGWLFCCTAKARLYVPTDTHRRKTLKNLNCTKEKRKLSIWRSQNQPQECETKADSQKQGLYSALTLQRAQQTGKEGQQPASGNGWFQMLHRCSHLVFLSRIKSQDFKPKHSKSTATRLSRTKWLSQISRNWAMYQTALGREGSLVDFDFPLSLKGYKFLAGLRQWFVAGWILVKITDSLLSSNHLGTKLCCSFKLFLL